MSAAGSYAQPLPRNPWDQVVPFGPGQALTPSPINPPGPGGRPQPRQYDYPVSWNLPGFSDRLVPWSILRAAADQIPLFRQCIQVRKDEIATLDWHIALSKRAVDRAMSEDPNANRQDIEAALRDRVAPHIGRLTAFWEDPDRRNGLDFIGWASKALEEHFVLDAIPVFPRRTRGGEPYSLEIIDGTTIKPLLDQWGHRPYPPYAAFQQILQGFPRGEFVADAEETDDGLVIPNAYSADRLSYLVHNVRTHTPYGYGAVEQSLVDGDLWLRRHGWMKSEYSDGVMPSGWLLAGQGQADWSPDQLREYERAINEYYSGQTENRHRYRILPWGMTPHDQSDAAERYKPDYDLFLLKLVARHFDTTIAELGFTEARGLGSQGWHQGQADVQDRAGTKPTLKRLQSWCTRLMRRYLDSPPELEFVIAGLEAEDELTDDQVAGQRVASGRMTLNEDRDRTGKPRYPFPEADMPFVQSPTGLTFIEGAQAQQAANQAMQQQIADAKSGLGAEVPGQPPEGDGGQAEALGTTTGDVGGQDAQDLADGIAKVDELARYKRWRKNRRSPSEPFRFLYHSAVDLPGLDPAIDPVVFKDYGGGVDPKAQTPATVWPGWMVDEATAAAGGLALSQALTGLVTADLVGRWLAAIGPHPDPTATVHTLGAVGADKQIATAIRHPLAGVYTEGWFIGDRSARSLLTGSPPDWGVWTPGRSGAARRLLSEDGQSQGLDLLLGQADVVIKSIARNRLIELARVLAEGVDSGAGTEAVTRDVRALLADPTHAQMVAQTELQRAQTAASIDRYSLAGVPTVRWLAFPGACPRCLANAEAEPVPVGEVFPSGDNGPPVHPSCRCEVIPEFEVEKVDHGLVGDVQARNLIAWFNKGADGQIAWGAEGDFAECVRIAGGHMPEGKAKGFCANRHHDVTGEWPGPHAHGG